MTRDHLTAIAVAWIARVWRDRDLDAIDELAGRHPRGAEPAGRAAATGLCRGGLVQRIQTLVISHGESSYHRE